eukprot:gene8420-10718_t
MGMPIGERPNALILASHEDDIHMTDGLTSSLKETLSVGYLEVGGEEDFKDRLGVSFDVRLQFGKVFLSTFDVVIIGE